MRILWDKKLIRLSDGSYIAWGLKRKKFFFANKNELKLNCAIIEYYKEREKCDKKVISDLNKIIAELKEELKAKQVVLNDFKSRVETVTDRFNRKSSQLTYAKTIIQDLLDNTDEYARQRAIDFLKEE